MHSFILLYLKGSAVGEGGNTLSSPTWLLPCPCQTWIRDDEQDGVGRVLNQLRDDALEDVGVPLDEREASLAFSLAGAGGDDAHARGRRHSIVCAGVDLDVPGRRTEVIMFST